MQVYLTNRRTSKTKNYKEEKELKQNILAIYCVYIRFSTIIFDIFQYTLKNMRFLSMLHYYTVSNNRTTYNICFMSIKVL